MSWWGLININIEEIFQADLNEMLFRSWKSNCDLDSWVQRLKIKIKNNQAQKESAGSAYYVHNTIISIIWIIVWKIEQS